MTENTEPLFASREEEAIVTFVAENEDQWDADRWGEFRRQVACFKFGAEYQKKKLSLGKQEIKRGEM